MSRNLELQPSFDDRQDFDYASRGFIDSLKPCIIEAISGGAAWNSEDYKFLESDKCPPTVNPKLWRQGQLSLPQGLFEVTPGIYQLRGLDLSNMTVVEGKTGIIIIDPLTSDECAATALNLYQKHRGKRPITAMIYSHSHADHFGGAGGILETAQQTPTSIPIIAPEFFMEEATNENILVGPAMARRAVYMYGKTLPVSPEGQVGCGLGLRVSTGRLSLMAPNTTIKETGEQLEIDGVKIVFQMVPNTEAPAEMNMHFPSHRALLIAECATHCMHNIITLRGTLVRDAKAWGRYLDETLVLYGSDSDVLFSSHHWPTWGTKNLSKLLSEQRDLYTYLHDQTIRLMNTGLNGTEIAEQLRLPPALQTSWHAQGFYGSVSHNVKGIYQRYMTWFDGNPANLWKHPPKAEAQRFVDCMGGIASVVQKAEDYVQKQDLRFAATLLDYVVQVDPTYSAGRLTLAAVYEKMGYGAENATWRNFYLCAALDLRSPVKDTQKSLVSRRRLRPDASVEQWLDCLSVALDGELAANDCLAFGWNVTGEGTLYRVNVSNGALTSRIVSKSGGLGDVGFNLTASKGELYRSLNGDIEIARKCGKGNLAAWSKFLTACGIPHQVVQSSSL